MITFEMPGWRAAARVCGLSALAAASLLNQGLRAEDQPAPKPEAKDVQPAAERPRVRYWLNDPTQPAPAGEPKGDGKDPAPAPKPAETVADADLSTADGRRKSIEKEFKRLLDEAEALYDHREYQRSIQICRNVLSADPRNGRAVEIMSRAHNKLANVDQLVTEKAADRKDREALLESAEHSVRPPVRSPEIRPAWPRREDDPILPKQKKMGSMLEQQVSVDFMKADLDWVFNTLFVLTGVNIIADPSAIEGKKLTLHVDQIPLKEVLDFIVRNNDGIQYSATEHAIWITATGASDLKKIMVPRVYPLHHGLVTTRPNANTQAGQRSNTTGRANRGSGGGGGGGGGQGGGGQGQQQQTFTSYIEDVLSELSSQADAQTFPTGSRYFIDKQSNQLVLFTTPSGHERIAKFLDAFDQPAMQVLIKARFLEVALESNKSLGVNIQQLGGRVDQLGLGLNTSGADRSGTPTELFGSLGTGTLLTVTGVRSDPQFQVVVNALLNNRNTKVLSEPQIIAINNKESAIDVTTQFSYITDLREVTATQFGGNGTATTNVVAFVPQFDTENVGFSLNVTPSIGRDLKTINLHIRPVIDSLAQGQSISQFQQFETGQQTANGAFVPPVIQRPTIDQTSLETDVVLEDNGYVIIGGLIRNRNDSVERKIPGLSRIPGLGNLFKSKGEQRSTSNLMIIVEAQIITPRGRTYKTDPAPDDTDIREGGTLRAPGQTSGVKRPEAVNKALGLPAEPETVKAVPAPGDEQTPTPVQKPVQFSGQKGWSTAQEEATSDAK